MPKEPRRGYATTLPESLCDWLKEESERSDMPQSKLIEEAVRDLKAKRIAERKQRKAARKQQRSPTNRELPRQK